MEVARYRLLKSKIEGTWSMRGGNALKNGRMKSINYYPGSDSIYDQDNRDTSIKPKTVIFRYNDTLSDPAVEVIVPIADKSLIDYLEAHPFNGRFYKRYDPDGEAKSKLQKYQNIEKALGYVKESNDMKSKAIGLSVLGFEYLSYSDVQVKTILHQKATENPDFIIRAFESEDYQNRYLSSLGYSTGIISSNVSNNKVVWSDNGGEVLSFAKGESPIDKLTDFLNSRSEEAVLFLKELEERFARIFPEERAEKTDFLSKLHWEFKNKTGKEVPLRYRNDIEWLQEKIKN